MVQLDEGVGNLERFIGLLTDTSSKLDEGVEGLDQAAGDLDRVEGETEDTLGDFASTLDDIAGEIGEAADSTAEGIDTLSQQAREIAQERCAGAESEATAGGDAFEEKVESGGDALDTETAGTVNDGFKVFGETLDRSTRDLKEAGEAAEKALTTLGHDAAGEQVEADEAFGRSETAFDGAEAEIGTHASAIEAAAADTVSNLEGAGEDLETECTSLQGEADTTYEAIGDGVESESDELATETQDMLETTADDLNTEASEPITEALTLAVDEAGGEYDGALDDVSALLGDAADVCTELEPLVAELDRSQNVVETIDKMLKAME